MFGQIRTFRKTKPTPRRIIRASLPASRAPARMIEVPDDRARRDSALDDRIAAVTRDAQRLTALITEVERVGRSSRPLVSYTGSWPCVLKQRPGNPGEHWSKGLNMQGGVRVWSSSDPSISEIYRGKTEGWMRKLIKLIEQQRTILNRSITALNRQRGSTLSGIENTGFSGLVTPGLLGFALGGAAVYIMIK